MPFFTSQFYGVVKGKTFPFTTAVAGSAELIDLAISSFSQGLDLIIQTYTVVFDSRWASSSWRVNCSRTLLATQERYLVLSPHLCAWLPYVLPIRVASHSRRPGESTVFVRFLRPRNGAWLCRRTSLLFTMSYLTSRKRSTLTPK